jgi:hypothetical protein
MLCLALTLFALSATPAEDLAEARAAEAELDYQRAKILLVGLLDRADLSDSERLESHFLAGQIERILGNDTEARLHFMSVLNKQPDWPLAAETPPKVRTFFELVREEVKERRRAEDAAKAERDANVIAVVEPKGPPVLGIAVAGGGAAVMVAGLVGGVVGEMMFSQTDAAFEDRAVARTLAIGGWTAAGLGALVGAGGAALLVAGE